MPLEKLIMALGIRYVGEETAIELAHYFIAEKHHANLSIAELVQIGTSFSAEKLREIEGFGEKVAEEVAIWFHQQKHQKFLEKLAKVGVTPVIEETKVKQILSGKSFVVTGTMKSMSREEAKEKIRQYGGKVQGSVSSKTAYLVCGKNPGSKLTDAKKLGVPVLDEKEFLKMIGTS